MDGWFVGKKCVEMDCNLRIFATGGGCKTDGFFFETINYCSRRLISGNLI
jgi:hypothetical protein